jgi:hypothetical protein
MEQHSLSGAAVAAAAPEAPIFLLDAYLAVVVVYLAAAPADLPFPPPQQSRLRRALANLRFADREGSTELLPACK